MTLLKKLLPIACCWVGMAPCVHGAKVGQWVGPSQSAAAASTSITDESGNGRTATLSVNTDSIDDTDRPGTAGSYSFALNGTNNYFSLPNFATILGDNASFCMWMKRTNATPGSDSTSGIANLGPTAVSGGATHWPYSDGVGYVSFFRGVNNTTISRVNSITMPGDSRTAWFHFAVTTTPGTNGWKLYINGNLVTQTTGLSSIYYDADAWEVGRSNGASIWFPGKVWDVRLYDNTLSGSDITAIIAEKDSGGGGGGNGLTYPLIIGKIDRQQKHFALYGVYALAP